jgi:hypothetical protein
MKKEEYVRLKQTEFALREKYPYWSQSKRTWLALQIINLVPSGRKRW